MLGWTIGLNFNLADRSTVYTLTLQPDGVDFKGYFYSNIPELPLFDQFLEYFE